MRRTIAEHTAAVRELLAPALQRLREHAPETIPVGDPDLRTRVTAAAILTGTPLPPFDNSQMDGYAVRAADLADASASAPVSLPIGRTTAAGDRIGQHAPGTASPIMTGAVVPRGADAVVPIERCEPPQFGALSRVGDPPPTGSVAFSAPVEVGRFVRRAGEDARVGSEILPEGVRLTPARIGVLAAAGVVAVPVRPTLRVLVCSTGDELLRTDSLGAVSRGAATGLIHDANTPMLAAALRDAGAVVTTLRSGDRANDFRDAVLGSLAEVDLVITSGGISAGAFEVVREALAPLGIAFGSVAMQPGGPQGLGSLDRDGTAIPVVCFPGNPVSALISAETFVLPLLRDAAGLPAERRRERLRLAHDAESPVDKHQVRRGRIGADGRVTVSAPGSHLLSELAAADVLVHLPLGIDHFPADTPVDTWRLHD
ncbi:molybdopterin molybdotransferase MoeA [Leucobacter rhizosphaerae]|uniref:Molybdopterin molybdenumtransferase n=1 Tax=Leucobacter rhizosphaerae TaxID=2932245 RepID=A0ABY4FVT3_9MICO|nr:gephyrin-like molybdotransferase Glp [Leucobacter rhizosphaerae]UOQ60416.1 molybdopterin molybdotransferase MoeA [Leucobacter rhizosphaerae]